jgi:hypothetical protein
MADAVGPAQMDGLVDALGAASFARMQCAINIICQHSPKCVFELFCRIVRFGASQVKTHHAPIFESHGQVGQAVGFFRAYVAYPAQNDASPDLVFVLSEFKAL